MEGGKDLHAASADNHEHETAGPSQVKERPESSSSDLGLPFKLPPGYRFCPSDEELIIDYLIPKVQNKPLPHNNIKDVNLYAFNPQDLTAQYKNSSKGVKEWYFFTPRDKKYKNGSRPNRAAGNGYWKATGADKPIHSDSKIVGVRKALVFYEGKPPRGLKTSWIMHEFRINDDGVSRKRDNNTMRLDDWVLCRIYQKPNNEKSPKGSPKSRSRNDSDEQFVVEEFHDHGDDIISSTPEIFDCGDVTAPLHGDAGPFVNYSPDYGLSSYNPLIPPPCDPNFCDPCYGFYGNNWVDYGQVDSLLAPEPIVSEPPPPHNSMMMSSRYEPRPQFMNMGDHELSFYADNHMNLQPEIFPRNAPPQPDFFIKDEVDGDVHQMNELFRQQTALSKRHRRN